MIIDYILDEENNELEIRYKDSYTSDDMKLPMHKLINELIAINTLYPNNILSNYYLFGMCDHTGYSVTNDDEYCGGVNLAGENLSELVAMLKRLYEHGEFQFIPMSTVRIDLLII